MTQLSRSALKRAQWAYDLCNSSYYYGVPGVVVIDSHKPGPTLGVTVCTHGNEPSGLEVIYRLIKESDVLGQLKHGRVMFVLNNRSAAGTYLELEHRLALDDPERNRLLEQTRYLGVNMNRLPETTMLRSDAKAIEVKRARELAPVWDEFDVGFDIHSTLANVGAMLISRGNDLPVDLIKGFPIDIIFSNIDQAQIGVPAFSFYGKDKNKPVFAIEAGQHTSAAAREVATACVMALLANLGMIDSPEGLEMSPREYKEYVIPQNLMFPDMSYEFAENFKTFDTMKKGMLVARSTNPDLPDIMAPYEGHFIFPSAKRGVEKDISEDMAFLSLPERIRTL